MEQIDIYIAMGHKKNITSKMGQNIVMLLSDEKKYIDCYDIMSKDKKNFIKLWSDGNRYIKIAMDHKI